MRNTLKHTTLAICLVCVGGSAKAAPTEAQPPFAQKQDPYVSSHCFNTGNDLDYIPNNDVLMPDSRGCDAGRRMTLKGLGTLKAEPLALKYLENTEQMSNDTAALINSSSKWSEWNQNVDSAINKSFSNLEERVSANDKLVVAKATFSIKNDGEIEVIYLGNYSLIPKFESMIRKAVMSLNGNPVLRFPEPANVNAIVKSGRFIQNFGISKLDERARSSLAGPRPVIR